MEQTWLQCRLYHGVFCMFSPIWIWAQFTDILVYRKIWNCYNVETWRWSNVETCQLSNPASFQHCYNVGTWRCSNVFPASFWLLGSCVGSLWGRSSATGTSANGLCLRMKFWLYSAELRGLPHVYPNYYQSKKGLYWTEYAFIISRCHKCWTHILSLQYDSLISTSQCQAISI